MTSHRGRLYVVATPLGNLGDITIRALDILKQVRLIACEDTRRTAKLLNHYQIANRLVSYHEFNEKTRTPQILDTLNDGHDVALVSDAGTPMVSDPGWYMIRRCAEAGISVVPVPGPSALSAALSVTHLPVERFVFAGFPPSRATARRKLLAEMATGALSVVFYEAPHRIIKLVDDLLAIWGDRDCVFCRELTKLHEEILRCRLSELAAALKSRESVKGEITLVVAGASETAETTDSVGEEDLATMYRELRERGISGKDVLREMMRRTGLPRNRLYGIILDLDAQDSR